MIFDSRLGPFEGKLPWNSKFIPNLVQLAEFERDPQVVLIALAMNSGQGRFLESDDPLPAEVIQNLKKEMSENVN